MTLLPSQQEDAWSRFLSFVKTHCSQVEYTNWLTPIRCLSHSSHHVTLEVPNVFVQEYLLENYKEVLTSFLPTDAKGEPLLSFVIQDRTVSALALSKKRDFSQRLDPLPLHSSMKKEGKGVPFNSHYTFKNFIEGPSNRFIKSAAVGVATHPGKSYNPLFIYGGVGLGKTHLLHAIGHHLAGPRLRHRVQNITTEGFVNDLVVHLKNKSVDQMKRFYRSTLDVLLVDDIQFLQKLPNFETELCNTFESLIHQSKQIVMTSDQPPNKLKLSERMTARMEWGLVAHIEPPDLETRVAILQHKAEEKGLLLDQELAFYIAERIYHNVRQLEGAVNRLNAYCHLMNEDLSKELIDSMIGDMFRMPPHHQISIDRILRSVAAMYRVHISEIQGSSRRKEVVTPRQVAMYLAKELLDDSLTQIASAFGKKTHSTLLHAWKKIAKQIADNPFLCRQIQMIRQEIGALPHTP